MSFKIVPIQSFLKEVKHLSKKHPSLKDDLRNLGAELALNPRLGQPIAIKYDCKSPVKVRVKAAAHGLLPI
jgi:hypothetical protein